MYCTEVSYLGHFGGVRPRAGKNILLFPMGERGVCRVFVGFGYWTSPL